MRGLGILAACAAAAACGDNLEPRGAWYAGGLQAIDISDPTTPVQLAELRSEPLASVAVEDPGLGGSKVEMWSYPIIKDG